MSCRNHDLHAFIMKKSRSQTTNSLWRRTSSHLLSQGHGYVQFNNGERNWLLIRIHCHCIQKCRVESESDIIQSAQQLGYGLDDRWTVVRFSVGERAFFFFFFPLCLKRPCRSEAQQTSYSMDNKGSFFGAKAARAWSWPLPSRSEVTNQQIYNPIPPHALITCTPTHLSLLTNRQLNVSWEFFAELIE